MIHYFLENQVEDIRKRALEGKLTGPEFVGQGCTCRVGSDSYGYYVAEILKPGKLVALIMADDEYVTSWTDGDMTCTMPTDKLVKNAAAGPDGPNPYFDYIMRYGKSWYRCQIINGKIARQRRSHAGLSWNGAFSYHDPSV